MSKPYSEMTPAERTLDRIAKNREIDARVEQTLKEKKSKKARREVVKLSRDLNTLRAGLPADAKKDFDEVLARALAPMVTFRTVRGIF